MNDTWALNPWLRAKVSDLEHAKSENVWQLHPEYDQGSKLFPVYLDGVGIAKIPPFNMPAAGRHYSASRPPTCS